MKTKSNYHADPNTHFVMNAAVAIVFERIIKEAIYGEKKCTKPGKLLEQRPTRKWREIGSVERTFS